MRVLLRTQRSPPATRPSPIRHGRALFGTRSWASSASGARAVSARERAADPEAATVVLKPLGQLLHSSHRLGRSLKVRWYGRNMLVAIVVAAPRRSLLLEKSTLADATLLSRGHGLGVGDWGDVTLRWRLEVASHDTRRQATDNLMSDRAEQPGNVLGEDVLRARAANEHDLVAEPHGLGIVGQHNRE